MSEPLTRRDVKFGESDFLKNLNGEARNYEVATYDIETTTDLTKVFLVGFYDGARYFFFESEPTEPEKDGGAIDQFMRWILARPGYQRFRIYAHNAGNFDNLYLVAWAIEHPEEVELEIIPIQSSVLSLTIKKRNGARPAKFQFIDSMKLMPGSLKDVAKAFGFSDDENKIEIEDYETLHLNPLRYDYLQRDCEILWKCVDKFSKLLVDSGGEVGITTPSTAMKVYRRRFQDGPIETNRHWPGCPDSDCRGCLHDFIRRGYYGGRTECYRESFDGPGLLSVGDFNSMYPAVMQEKLPCFLVGVDDGLVKWNKYGAFRAGFIECTVEIPESCYLPPLAHRHDGKLIFPVGKFTGVWTTEELKRLEMVGGRIVKYGRSAWFGTKDLFSSFVATWYSYRNKDAPDYSKSMDTIAKLMLNSLYGKFGQGEEREKIWIYPSDEELDRGTIVQLPNAKDGVMKEDVFTKTTYVIPHIAAWITALARCRLWDEMYRLLATGKRVFYADTDSIFTDAPVQNSKILGDLKLEYRVSKAIFVAPKLYALKKEDGTEVVKAKGFGGGFGSARITSYDQFIRMISVGEEHRVKRITKLREGLHRDSGQFPRLKEVTKVVKGRDTKREHLGNGDTQPIRLYED